jgi:hypothetical protein
MGKKKQISSEMGEEMWWQSVGALLLITSANCGVPNGKRVGLEVALRQLAGCMGP